VSRLLAIGAGLLGVLLVPLALSQPTALLLVPAHLGLSVLVCAGAAVDGLAGWAERSRRWGLFYLVATAAMTGALEVGAQVHGSALGYWGVPWLAAVLWGWVPPLVSGIAGAWAERRRAPVRRRVE
jgi:hypothetical protein